MVDSWDGGPAGGRNMAGMRRSITPWKIIGSRGNPSNSHSYGMWTLCFAKIRCALKIARFLPRRLSHPGYPFTLERQESFPGNPSGIPVYIRMEEPGRFHDATL